MKPATRLFESFHGEGHYGVHPFGLRPEYKSYRSPHAPPYDSLYHCARKRQLTEITRYKIDPNFHGINLRKATNVYVKFSRLVLAPLLAFAMALCHTSNPTGTVSH